MDLSTTYLGLKLKHPVVASAGPVSQTIDGIRSLEDGGASAIVLFSLFEEQLRFERAAYEHLTAISGESFGEALSYFPTVADYEVRPDSYLRLIAQAKEHTRVPIIASLNGVTAEGWTRYAADMAEAGADAIELNIYRVSADIYEPAREVEERYLEVVRAVRSAISVPFAVKVGPYFSSMGEMARRIVEAGADGLVLFNRFYQPDFDLDSLEVVRSLELSTGKEIRLPLMWLALLYGRIPCSLAATTGVHSGHDVIKYLLAGADVTMTTSAVLRDGPDSLGRIVDEARTWLESRGYASVQQMKGAMSRLNVSDPAEFERANYIRVLQSYQSAYIV